MYTTSGILLVLRIKFQDLTGLDPGDNTFK